MALDALAVYTVGMEPTKTCTSCLTSKDISSFRPNKMGAQGRYSKCRECEAGVRRAKEGTEARKTAYKKYRASEKGKSAQREAKERYRRSEKGRQTDRAYYRSRHWYMLCKAAVNNAVQAGTLPSATASCCEVNAACRGRNQWHHDSYAKEDWLNVRCLCEKHHREWHRTNTPKPFSKASGV